MALKWYQKASVQVAMVTTVGFIIVALITVAHQRSELRQDNKTLQQKLQTTLATLDDTKHERDKFQLQLMPFLAAADRSFPNIKKDERLDRLINLVEQIGADLEKSLPFQISDQNRQLLFSGIQQLTEQEKVIQNPPKIYLLKFPGQTADAAEFLDLLQTAFDKSGRKAETRFNMDIKVTTLDGCNSWDGVIVTAKDLKNSPLVAKGVFGLCRQIGLRTWSQEGHGYGPNAIVIYAHRLSAGAKKQ